MGDHQAAREPRAFITSSRAAEILGRAALLTLEQSCDFWEYREEMYRLDSIPFSEATLHKCAAENDQSRKWRLAFLLGIKPMLILCKFPMASRIMPLGASEHADVVVISETRTQPTFSEIAPAFIMNPKHERWACASQPRGWRLIDFQPRYGSLSWDDQTTLLEAKGLRRAHERDVLEAMFCFTGTTGEEFLTTSSHWGYPAANGQSPVLVTTCSDGVYLSETFPASVAFYDRLGVCGEILSEE